MKVALDCNALIAWSSTRDEDDVARIESLFDNTNQVIVPMPVFAEFLVGARENEDTWLESLTRKPRFTIAPFDRRSAYECAELAHRIRAMSPNGTKRGNGRKDAWQKVKFDRQILAIAQANGCDLLVCADGELKDEAISLGMRALAVREIPLPPGAAQRKLDLAGTQQSEATGPLRAPGP